jgi:sirohydrochlorin ferrochelatase
MPLTAILLIAHGSRHEPANVDLRSMAVDLAARGDYPIIEPAFLELAEPDIAAGGSACVARGAGRVLMVPYFLSAGVHLVRDLTAARDALIGRHPGVEFVLGPPLGPHPLLQMLVLERVRELETHGPPADLASAAEMAARYVPIGEHAQGTSVSAEQAVGIDEERVKG